MTSDSSPGTSRGPYPTQLLLDLATNPLDPGYAAAHARRGGAPPSRPWLERACAAVGAALIGFTLAFAYVHTHRSAPQTAKIHDDLVARVQAADHMADRLQSRAQQLGIQVNTIRDEALAGNSLSREIDRDQLVAGQVAVKGPGLEVELRNPPTAKSTEPPGSGGSDQPGIGTTLTDRDIRSVVNELWLDGAEAITVNNIRLTPTSSIRIAGEAVLVDFQPIASPYVIRAIGNKNDLATSFASSDVASRYNTLISANGIGFRFTERSSMTLPAGAVVTPRYAVAGGRAR